MDAILEPRLVPTDLRTNPYYTMYYRNLAWFLLLGIIPLILLAYWNYNIYKHMKSSSNLVEQNSETTRLYTQSRNNQENELAKVLIGIVIMFVCCHALRFFINFYEAIIIKRLIWCHSKRQNGFSLWFLIAVDIKELMLVINSSTNMIIYCCLNSNFRQQLLKCIMKRHKRSNQGTELQ